MGLVGFELVVAEVDAKDGASDILAEVDFGHPGVVGGGGEFPSAVWIEAKAGIHDVGKVFFEGLDVFAVGAVFAEGGFEADDVRIDERFDGGDDGAGISVFEHGRDVAKLGIEAVG